MGPLPCFPHSNSQSLKAEQWVSLTTYCPWATCLGLTSLIMSPSGLIVGRRELEMHLRADYRLWGAHFESERTYFGTERACLVFERTDLRSERGLSSLGGMNVRMDGWTDRCPKILPLTYRTSALWGRCPKRKYFRICRSYSGIRGKTA